MPSYNTGNAELFRIGLTRYGSDGLDENPESQYMDVVSGIIDSKQVYDTMPVRLGFGLFQRRNIGTMAPMQEEIIKTKNVQAYRYVLGFNLPLNAMDRDPNGFIKGKGPLLQAAAVHTHNYLAADAFLRTGTTGSTAITSAIDGLPLCSTAGHTVRGATAQVNKSTATQSAADFITVMGVLASQFSAEGVPIGRINEFEVLCTPASQMPIQVVIDSELRAGGNNNDKNLLGMKIKAVRAMDWWAIAGTAIADDYIVQPFEKSKKPLFGIRTQGVRVGTQDDISLGQMKTVASFEIGFDALTHHGIYYASGS